MANTNIEKRVASSKNTDKVFRDHSLETIQCIRVSLIDFILIASI